MDTSGPILFLCLLVVVLLFLLLGNNGTVRSTSTHRKKTQSFDPGKIIEVTDSHGNKHKALLLPDDKKPDPPRRGMKWKYR